MIALSLYPLRIFVIEIIVQSLPGQAELQHVPANGLRVFDFHKNAGMVSILSV